MSAATTKIVKWAAAGCVVAIIAVIVTFFCFKNKPSVKVYGHDVYPTSLKQIIKATVKSKHGSAVTRVVKFGVKNFGTIGASRTQIFDTYEPIVKATPVAKNDCINSCELLFI